MREIGRLRSQLYRSGGIAACRTTGQYLFKRVVPQASDFDGVSFSDAPDSFIDSSPFSPAPNHVE